MNLGIWYYDIMSKNVQIIIIFTRGQKLMILKFKHLKKLKFDLKNDLKCPKLVSY